MRGIAKLLFGGDDGDDDQLLGLLAGDDDWFRAADQARRTGEWCGTTPGRGAVEDAVRGVPRAGRIMRPMSAPDFAPKITARYARSRARRGGTRVRGGLPRVHRVGAPGADEGQRNEAGALITGFLGPDGADHSVVSRELPPFEHVNLQAALDAWSARPGRAVEVHGILLPPHHSIMLQQLVSTEMMFARLRLTAPALVDLPNGPATTLGCLKLALLLVTDARGRYVVMVQSPSDQHPTLEVEIAGLPVADAQAVLGELDKLRSELNVYRGHLLDVTLAPMGGVALTFAVPPGLRRDDVVLPDAVLTRVERHALGVAAHRDALLAVGQHLKRGLLLYGPPGTGKTHTTRYLLGQMTGYTRLILTGRALIGVGAVTDLARDLQPAVVVLEDVDLVAEDRSLARRQAPCCSTCSTRWTARRPTRTCCSCSPPTAPTCSSRPWPRARAGWTSRWRSNCPTPPPGRGCSPSTAGACRWT